MRIAIIVTDLTPPRIGGISKVATSLAEHLCKDGHEVVVYTLERSASLHQNQPYQVEIVRPKLVLYQDYPVVSFSLAAFRKVLKDHRTKPFDVTHSMNLNSIAYTFFRRKMVKAGLPHVSTAFETIQMDMKAKWRDFWQQPNLHTFAQIIIEGLLCPWQKTYIGWADGISTEDEETREGLSKMGIAPERVTLIPSGVNLEDYLGFEGDRPIEYPYWLCPGRVDPRKGNPTLIHAYAKLVESGIQTPKLVFAGGGRGTHLEGMMNLAKELELDDKIHFTGRVDDMRPWYQHAEAVLIPSLSEGIPITLQEALAFDKRVVCSKLHGTYSFASEVSTISWAEPGDTSDWSNSLKSLVIETPYSYTGVGPKFMEEYSWEKVSQRYASLYQHGISQSE